MHIGEIIVTGTDVFTPWFTRQAENAIFTYERIQIFGSGDAVDVSLYQKNTEDQGVGTLLSGTWTGSGNLFTRRIEGLQEMFRFRIKGLTGGIAVLFRFLDTTWYDTARTGL